MTTRAQLQRYVQRIVFSTQDSVVPITITFPHPLLAEEIEDLDALFQIFINQQRRLAGERERAQREAVIEQLTDRQRAEP